MPLQARGEFALVKEELESALDLSGQPVKRGTMAHKHIVYMMLADAAAQLRDPDALARNAALLEELARRDGHRPYLAVAHRCFGVLNLLNGEYGEAEVRLGQALTLFEESGLQWQTGRTLFDLAELDLAREDEAGAGAYFERALAEFKALGAGPDIRKTNVAMDALGVGAG